MGFNFPEENLGKWFVSYVFPYVEVIGVRIFPCSVIESFEYVIAIGVNFEWWQVGGKGSGDKGKL